MIDYKVTITLMSGNMLIYFIPAKNWKDAVLDAVDSMKETRTNTRNKHWKDWKVRGIEVVIIDELP